MTSNKMSIILSREFELDFSRHSFNVLASQGYIMRTLFGSIGSRVYVNSLFIRGILGSFEGFVVV